MNLEDKIRKQIENLVKTSCPSDDFIDISIGNILVTIKSGNKQPSEELLNKYRNNPIYHRLVETMEYQLINKNVTKEELQNAAKIAIALFEERESRKISIGLVEYNDL